MTSTTAKVVTLSHRFMIILTFSLKMKINLWTDIHSPREYAKISYVVEVITSDE